MILLIIFLAFTVLDSWSEIIKQCRSSSRFESMARSLAPFPSLTEPFPRIAILAPDLVSISFKVFPRGPIIRPTVSRARDHRLVKMSNATCFSAGYGKSAMRGKFTKVNLRIVVDRNVNLFVSSCRATVISGKAVVRKQLRGFFDKLMAFPFKSLFVALLTGVCPTSLRIILRRWGLGTVHESQRDGRDGRNEAYRLLWGGAKSSILSFEDIS